MNLQDSYVYQLDLEWTGRRAGRLSAEGFQELEISAPPEFHGESGVWTPELLLVASVASCLMTTFLAIAEIAKLHVISYHSRAFGRLENVPGEGYRFTEINLLPEISVAHEDVEKALRALAKAEKNCFVSKSLRTTVQVEPHFAAAVAEVAQ